MVLGVCRRMLRREQDVEDAFQATFLTLVRRAGCIARREALGCWLHQVAYRIGLRARIQAGRGGLTDQECIESAAAPTDHEHAEEWRELLDEEVQRLPRRYRLPFVLCYIEGKTHAEAAQLLACPPGTIASRLAWARDRLRARLTARGITLPATLVCLAVSAESQAASMAALIATALRTARVFTTGTLTGSPTIPAHVTTWSKGVVRAMFLSKIQILGAFVLASVLVGAGGSVLWQRVQADGNDTVTSDEPPVQASVQPPQKPKVSRPPTDSKPTAAQEVELLQIELGKAEADYQQIEANWDLRIADIRRELWEQETKYRQKKARLAFEAKRTSKALEMAESRYERLTHAMDEAGKTDGRVGEWQKRQQEAQKQAEQLGAKLLEYELELAAGDEPSDRRKLHLGSLERQRAMEVGRARKRIEAIERKLHSAAGRDPADHLQELGRKLDALTQAVEDLRKALRR
jgi:RNA polymerase sigma factor (sigma-70 family)